MRSNELIWRLNFLDLADTSSASGDSNIGATLFARCRHWDAVLARLLARCWDEKPALRPPFSEILQILTDEHVKAFNMTADDLTSSDAHIVGGGGCRCLVS